VAWAATGTWVAVGAGVLRCVGAGVGVGVGLGLGVGLGDAVVVVAAGGVLAGAASAGFVLATIADWLLLAANPSVDAPHAATGKAMRAATATPHTLVSLFICSSPPQLRLRVPENTGPQFRNIP
jgi:hypothetical protein